MKPIILIAGGLLIGVGGGTVAGAIRVKGEVEAELAARADSIAVLEAELGASTGHDDADPAVLDDHGDAGATGLDAESTAGEAEHPVELPGLAEESTDPDVTPHTTTDDHPADPETGPAAEGSAMTAGAESTDGVETPAAGTEATPPIGDALTRANDPVPGSSATTGSIPSDPERPAVTAEGARRMAKIFAAMRAADAAGVMAELGDREVAAILNELNDRQAAAILGQFDAERAARLGRLMLGGGGS